MPRRGHIRMLVLLFVAVLTLAGCKETKANPGALYPDTQDVHVEDVRIVQSSENAVGLSAGTATYVIARIKFTNHTGNDFAPLIDHFVLTTVDGNRYFGMDSGSTLLAGISNPRTAVKDGQSQEYTVGFRTDTAFNGSISYEIAH